MSALSRFLSGEMVGNAVGRWLDAKLEPRYRAKAKRLGGEKTYQEVLEYERSRGSPHAAERAFMAAFFEKRERDRQRK